MGNGTVASKFRLGTSASNSRSPSGTPSLSQKARNEKTSVESYVEVLPQKNSVESPSTHHPNNCVRCYRLKKKCSRSYPRCLNCLKSGSVCDYVERNNKRTKRDQKLAQLQEQGSQGATKTNSPVLNIDKDVKMNPSYHKPVSISSMLLKDMNEENVRINRTKVSGEQSIELLALKSTELTSMNNPKEEFMTMKPIEDEELPMIFISNYFSNYEHRYPFINKKLFLEEFKKIDFKNEAIITLEVYLIMSIGCLIYDSGKENRLFDSYFSEKVIRASLEVLNYNINSTTEDDLENMKILLLLTIYSLNVSNESLCWSLVGILDRLVIKLDLFKNSSTVIKERIFWSTYIQDKELSLLLGRPSQLPNDSFIGLSPVLSSVFYEGEEIGIINQIVKFSQLQSSLLTLKFTVTTLSDEIKSEQLKEYSRKIENWRIETSSVIQKTISQTVFLKDHITFINMDYFYLLIELDQLSSTESFQFTLQFLSNSFTLLLNDNSKTNIEISLNNLYWYKKLFNVILFNLDSLDGIITVCSSEQNSVELTLKFGECYGNLQLIVNIMRYAQSRSRGFQERVKESSDLLEDLNKSCSAVNISETTAEEKSALSREISNLRNHMRRIL